MAGLDRFTSGPDHYWSDQKYVEGDPRRPVSISLEADTGKRKLGESEEAGEKETDKYAGIGIGLSGLLAENIVCHPFTILRRQCQVNVEARRYHTTPITLLPVLVNLNRWQGGSVLWKGWFKIVALISIHSLDQGLRDLLAPIRSDHTFMFSFQMPG